MRRRVEWILRGRYADAGVGPPTVEDWDLAALAARLRDAAGRIIPGPMVLAGACGLRVQERRSGPAVAVEDSILWVRTQDDIQERGLAVVRGVAAALLARELGRHSGADVVHLAGELVAPSDLVSRRGIRTVAQHQPQIPGWFLEAWAQRINGGPSSRQGAA